MNKGDFLSVILAMLIILLFSVYYWLFVCAIYKLVTFLFGLEFSWTISSCIWFISYTILLIKLGRRKR